MTDLTIELLPHKMSFRILEQSSRMYQFNLINIGDVAIGSSCYPAISMWNMWLRGTWKSRDTSIVYCGMYYKRTVEIFRKLQERGYDIKYEIRMKL